MVDAAAKGGKEVDVEILGNDGVSTMLGKMSIRELQGYEEGSRLLPSSWSVSSLCFLSGCRQLPF